ncbi:diaminopimelate epimerase [Desulfovibrio sp. OttesenSCG-928-C06]|nr:diaminopimelate epimerase [Desulfovibrio sp. OttesenSCG-928-C06]
MSSFVFDRRPTPLSEEYIKAMQLPDKLPFTKMEGLGNDYVYVWFEDLDSPLTDPCPLAARIADRNYGVGGDGMILIGRSKTADFRMRMFNVDGTEGEMCGNATRCVGKYVYDHGLTDKKSFTLETFGGTRVLDLNVRNGKVDTVRVNMGKPHLHPSELPMDVPGDSFINKEIVVDGQTYLGTAVSMGNPHFVVNLGEHGGVGRLDFAEFGPKFEHHKFFPRRVNTEFIEVLSRDRVRMRVWERGSDETLACGTGASASLVACALNGWTERSAVVELRGGELLIEWADNDIVYMTGPAREVFSGEFNVRG